jgi:hypothetical protein
MKRAFRVYKPVSIMTGLSAGKSAATAPRSDGETPMADYCNDASASRRNIHAAAQRQHDRVQRGQRVHAQPKPNIYDVSASSKSCDATARRDPRLDAGVAIAPSLDPPPDSDYPGFAPIREDRRTLIFAGQHGMMHPRRTERRRGQAYIPFNLLPKLRAARRVARASTAISLVDGSAKVADIKISGSWRTMVLFGEGPGGTFYQRRVDARSTTCPTRSRPIATT